MNFVPLLEMGKKKPSSAHFFKQKFKPMNYLRMKTTVFALAIISLFLNGCKKEKPGSNEVFMDNGKFNPSSITISAGTTIIWTNKENTIHTVTSDNSGTFNSGDLSQGKTFSYTFSLPGTYPYHCIHHSGMAATVIVQ